MKRLLAIFLILTATRLLAQDVMVIKSPKLKANDTIWTFKPTNYRSQQKYPVVFLLHGHSANYRSWSRLANLQDLANQYQFLIVCPDGQKKSWYINSPKADSAQYEDFFMQELMPKIAKSYHTDTARYFITGASMGGYGAMWLFLHHSNCFLSAGSTSGVLNLRYSAFRKTTIAYLLGPYSDDNKAYDDYSVVNWLYKIAGTNKAIIFDSGTEDYLYITSKKFREKCDELKIKATYTAQPGAHTGGYWSKTILQHFRFFAEQAALPTKP